jgi:opacity protein-like surface antigen
MAATKSIPIVLRTDAARARHRGDRIGPLFAALTVMSVHGTTRTSRHVRPWGGVDYTAGPIWSGIYNPVQFDHTSSGWTVGGGVEYGFTNN